MKHYPDYSDRRLNLRMVYACKITRKLKTIVFFILMTLTYVIKIDNIMYLGLIWEQYEKNPHFAGPLKGKADC